MARCDLDSRSYFSLYLASAAVATALAPLVASEMYVAAKVSAQVKSQTRQISIGQWNNRQVACHPICIGQWAQLLMVIYTAA